LWLNLPSAGVARLKQRIIFRPRAGAVTLTISLLFAWGLALPFFAADEVLHIRWPSDVPAAEMFDHSDSEKFGVGPLHL
jgi:hypothetical protein